MKKKVCFFLVFSLMFSSVISFSKSELTSSGLQFLKKNLGGNNFFVKGVRALQSIKGIFDTIVDRKNELIEKIKNYISSISFKQKYDDIISSIKENKKKICIYSCGTVVGVGTVYGISKALYIHKNEVKHFFIASLPIFFKDQLSNLHTQSMKLRPPFLWGGLGAGFLFYRRALPYMSYAKYRRYNTLWLYGKNSLFIIPLSLLSFRMIGSLIKQLNDVGFIQSVRTVRPRIRAFFATMKDMEHASFFQKINTFSIVYEEKLKLLIEQQRSKSAMAVDQQHKVDNAVKNFYSLQDEYTKSLIKEHRLSFVFDCLSRMEGSISTSVDAVLKKNLTLLSKNTIDDFDSVKSRAELLDAVKNEKEKINTYLDSPNFFVLMQRLRYMYDELFDEHKRALIPLESDFVHCLTADNKASQYNQHMLSMQKSLFLIKRLIEHITVLISKNNIKKHELLLQGESEEQTIALIMQQCIESSPQSFTTFLQRYAPSLKNNNHLPEEADHLSQFKKLVEGTQRKNSSEKPLFEISSEKPLMQLARSMLGNAMGNFENNNSYLQEVVKGIRVGDVTFFDDFRKLFINDFNLKTHLNNESDVSLGNSIKLWLTETHNRFPHDNAWYFKYQKDLMPIINTFKEDEMHKNTIGKIIDDIKKMFITSVKEYSNKKEEVENIINSDNKITEGITVLFNDLLYREVLKKILLSLFADNNDIQKNLLIHHMNDLWNRLLQRYNERRNRNIFKKIFIGIKKIIIDNDEEQGSLQVHDHFYTFNKVVKDYYNGESEYLLQFFGSNINEKSSANDTAFYGFLFGDKKKDTTKNIVQLHRNNLLNMNEFQRKMDKNEKIVTRLPYHIFITHGGVLASRKELLASNKLYESFIERYSTINTIKNNTAAAIKNFAAVVGMSNDLESFCVLHPKLINCLDIKKVTSMGICCGIGGAAIGAKALAFASSALLSPYVLGVGAAAIALKGIFSWLKGGSGKQKKVSSEGNAKGIFSFIKGCKKRKDYFDNKNIPGEIPRDVYQSDLNQSDVHQINLIEDNQIQSNVANNDDKWIDLSGNQSNGGNMNKLESCIDELD